MSSDEDRTGSPLSDRLNGTNGDLESRPDDDGDLFGSEEERESPSRKRKLDDPELDSGDDDGRRDREPAEDDDQLDYNLEPKRETISSVQLGRIKDPRPSDGELYLLNMPDFIGIESENFDPEAYAIPIQNHGSKEGPFSPFDVASSSLFWRHDPSNPRSSRIQSNSRIVRWSDGSFTLQIASNPKDHYRLDAKALRQLPNSINPRKPLPTFLRQKVNTTYDPNKEAHVYLAAPHETAGCFRLVSPITAALRILPTGSQSDSAIIALQADLKAAGAYEDPIATIKTLRVDPEKAKRDAENLERQKLAQIRKRENMEFKEATRNSKNYGRIRRSGGLTLRGLEGDDDELGMATTRPKKKQKKPRSNRRGEILTDTESEGGYGGGIRGRTREDEYDMDDKFLAGSDEEIETYEDGDEDAEGEPDEEDDPDVDDLEIEGRETVVKEKTRGGAAAAERTREVTPKRSRDDEMEEGEVGAAGSPHARKKRMVISDDEDE